jgi:hypothetical protein
MAKAVVMDGSPVWNCQYSRLKLKLNTDLLPAVSPVPTDGSNGSTTDELGAFASLTTDEDRERKAECASPGTYNVVVNPSSFKHLPEYSDDLKTLSPPQEPISSVPGDPNIVVLRQFEDINRRTLKDLCSLNSFEDDEVSIKPDPDTSLMHHAASLRVQTSRQSQQDTTPTGTSATTYTPPYHWVIEASQLQPQFSPPAQGTLFTTPFDVSHDASYRWPLEFLSLDALQQCCIGME